MMHLGDPLYGLRTGSIARLLALLVLCLPGLLALPASAAASGASPGTFETDMQPGSKGGEPVIAVDPRIPGFLLEEDGAGIKTSRDYGHSWKVVAGGNVDSPVAVAPDGTLLAHSSQSSATGYLLTVSKDDGATWSAPVQTFPGYANPQIEPQNGKVTLVGWDRAWSAVDQSTGAFYISIAVHTEQPANPTTDPAAAPAFLGCEATLFTNPLLPCGRRYMAASHDDGATWGTAYPIDSPDYPNTVTGGFSGIQVAAHHVVATAYYANAAPGASCPCVVFETSRDDGATWTRHVIPGAQPYVANGPLAVFNDNPNRAPYLYPVISDSTSVEFGPYPAVDPGHPGRYAVLMQDASRARLLVYQTSDYGASWSGPAILGGGAGSTDTLERPWLTYTPGGTLFAFWRDDHGAEGSPYDVYVAGAPAGEIPRFKAPVRLNADTSPGSANTSDDASIVTADAHYVYAGWGDMRSGNEIEPYFGSYRYTGAVERQSKAADRAG